VKGFQSACVCWISRGHQLKGLRVLAQARSEAYSCCLIGHAEVSTHGAKPSAHMKVWLLQESMKNSQALNSVCMEREEGRAKGERKTEGLNNAVEERVSPKTA